MGEAPAAGVNGSNGKAERTAARERKGRKTNTGQEVGTQPKIIGEKIEELERLGLKAQQAAKAYSDAIKTVSEKGGYNASNLRAFVAARLGDKVADKKRDCEQQLELLTEVGE